MDQKRYEELSLVLKDNIFRYSWCEGGPCACAGCVNVATRQKFIEVFIEPPTKVEWLEWALYNSLREREMLEDFVEGFAELKTSSPTVLNYRKWVDMSQKAKQHIEAMRRILR